MTKIKPERHLASTASLIQQQPSSFTMTIMCKLFYLGMCMLFFTPDPTWVNHFSLIALLLTTVTKQWIRIKKQFVTDTVFCDQVETLLSTIWSYN